MDGLTERLSCVSEALADTPPSQHAPLRLSLDGVPERDRRAVFREVIGREVIRYDIEPLPDVPAEIDVKLQALPGLMMMWGRIHGSHDKRTREMVAADCCDDIGMVVNLRGPHRVTYRDEELVLGDGEAIMLSVGEVYSFTHRPPGDLLAFRVPRAQFAPLVTGVEDCYFRRIPSTTPALRLLTDYAKVIQNGQASGSAELQRLVVGHIYDLMAVAIGATRDAAEAAQGRGLRAGRLQAIKEHIAENLDQADLSVAVLAVRHGCTPRFIQRLFEAEGATFTEYVLTQRLARAHRMLIDPRRAGDKITTIALDAGFADVSYFNRAFRQVYGDTPSGVRARVPQYA
jgi:AraC-like DNA-binding protein